MGQMLASAVLRRPLYGFKDIVPNSDLNYASATPLKLIHRVAQVYLREEFDPLPEIFSSFKYIY